MAALRRSPPPLSHSTASAMASTCDGDLRAWLVDVAAVNARFADKVLVALDAEEIINLEDLGLFATLPRFASCGISAINVAKICRALEQRRDEMHSAPGRIQCQGDAQLNNEFATPPARSRARALRLMLALLVRSSPRQRLVPSTMTG